MDCARPDMRAVAANASCAAITMAYTKSDIYYFAALGNTRPPSSSSEQP